MRHLHLIAILVIVALLSTGCASVTVSGKRFGSLPEDARHFVQPSQVTLYPTLKAAWSALETGYEYRTDDWYIADRYGQRISGGSDTWLMPSEVQTLIDAGRHGMDCEDGSIWLTSALRKQGYDAWLCVGTVTMDSSTYGHAWCMVRANGIWTTYETTTDSIAEGLPVIYDESGVLLVKYTLSWRTNGEIVWQNLLTGVRIEPLGPIPPSMIAQLKKVLE